MASASDNPYLVIGIDFGTTFSGVAWATNADRQENVITTWPNTGREEGKVPTELFYDDTKLDGWGFGINPEADPIRWFKLLLLRDEDIDPELRSNEYFLRAQRKLRENNVEEATTWVADYLRQLWEHILEVVVRARGESVLEALPIHAVITVPAIWKGYARQMMEKAVKLAGMLDKRPAGQTTLSFVPEPEAAALASLSESGRVVKQDDVYLICDAGGGTVDLITYQIESINPIRMKEAVEGTGGLCGGMFIDQEFEFLCQRRLGAKWGRLSQTSIKELLTIEWQQSIKPQFKPGKADKEYIVRIPAEAYVNGSLDDDTKEPQIKGGRIHFKSSHIQNTFTKVFNQIEELIGAQIKKASEQQLTVTGIILVGGLGGSPYLYDHLKARYAGSKIDILQSGGMKPRTAICRGATLKGILDKTNEANMGQDHAEQTYRLPISITSTISRSSLGVECARIYDPQKHRREDKYWDDYDEKWTAFDQIQWYLKRGDNVSKTDPISYDFHSTWTKNPPKEFTVGIYSCDNEDPPNRKDFTVKDLCEIKCTLDIPDSSFTDHMTPQGKIVKRLYYQIKMVPSGASMEFSIYHEGRKLGEQNVNVQFH